MLDNWLWHAHEKKAGSSLISNRTLTYLRGFPQPKTTKTQNSQQKHNLKSEKLKQSAAAKGHLFEWHPSPKTPKKTTTRTNILENIQNNKHLPKLAKVLFREGAFFAAAECSCGLWGPWPGLAGRGGGKGQRAGLL